MSDFEMLLSKYVDLPGKGVAHISVFQISKTKRYERFMVGTFQPKFFDGGVGSVESALSCIWTGKSCF